MAATARKGEDDCVGFRPSGFDSLVVEVEHGMAVLVAVSARLGEAYSDGGRDDGVRRRELRT